MKKNQAEKIEKELADLRLDYRSDRFPELSGLIDNCYSCLLYVNKEEFEALPEYEENFKKFKESYDKLQEGLNKLSNV